MLARTLAAGLALSTAIGCARPPPDATPVARQQPFPSVDELAAGPGGAELAHATSALARFQDPAVALREGYVHPENDGFTMGEHWHHPELLREPRCELERPAFLQYLVVDGQRRLIGTGYVCDADPGPPDWFDGNAIWHEHGPALCRWAKNATIDAQAFANTLPNELNTKTWREVCDDFWGEPLERKIVMLHTWNWIPAPNGRYVHENLAIPFLRAGLRVPTREELDTPVGRDALDALSLAQGDAGGRLAAGFLVTDFGLGDWLGYGGMLNRGRERGEEAVARMHEAERRGDTADYAAAAAWGAAARREMEREITAKLSPERRTVVERFLAELRVHDHHAAPAGNGGTEEVHPDHHSHP